MMLKESYKGVLFCRTPCILFNPVKLDNYDITGKYMCPLYKTTDRFG